MSNKMKIRIKIRIKKCNDNKETLNTTNPKDHISLKNDKLNFLSNLIQYFILND